MSVRIVCDSSCDILTLKDVDFRTVPLTITAGEKEWTDDAGMDINDMLDHLQSFKGPSHTACPGTGAWLNAFEGADEIYVVTLTGALSGTFSAALSARDLYLENHPNARIHVFDSLSTGPALRLDVEKLAELTQSGLPFERICKEAEKYFKSTRIFFAFQSLHNFAQNGRVSKAIAAAVGVLGIRIVGRASDEGTFQPLAKCRSDRSAISELIAQIEKLGTLPQKLRISHTQNAALANQLLQALKERFPKIDALVYEARGLTSYYGERGAVFIGVAP